MTVALTIFGILLAGLFIGLLIYSRRMTVRRRVVVALSNGISVSGVLWTRSIRHVIIRDATVHSEGQNIAADGEVIVDRSQVVYIQALPSEV